MLAVALEVILPVLGMAALGFAMGRKARMPVGALSSLTFNLFTPALVFSSLADIQVSAPVVLRILVVIAGGFVVMAALGAGLAAVLRRDRPTVAATALCGAVANMGNMGLPVSFLAFGQAGLDVAVVAFVVASVLTYSAGITIASFAGGRSVANALRAPFEVPALWAALAGVAANAIAFDVPTPLAAAASTLGGAAVPCMLVVLGLQVGDHLPRWSDLSTTGSLLVLRLVAGPAVAYGVTIAVGLAGLTQRTLVVLGGMPTAVVTTILATEYDARPALVTRTVVLSTVMSILTLTVLVATMR